LVSARDASTATGLCAAQRTLLSMLPLATGHGAVLVSPAAVADAGLAAHFTSRPSPRDPPGWAYVSLIPAANAGRF